MKWSPLDATSGGPSQDSPREDAIAVVVVRTEPLPAGFVDTLRAATRHDIDLVQVTTDPQLRDIPLNGRVVVVEPGFPYGAAVNAGVRETTDEYLVVVDPAVRWEPHAIDELLAAARRWPTGAAFGPLIKRADGVPFPSARSIPTLGLGIGHALFVRIWPGNPWTRGYRGEASPVERTAGWLSGSCLLMRRDAFDVIGGFDPGYVAFFEDVDLGERFGAAGFRNVFVPSATVTHFGDAVNGRSTPELTVAHHRSAWRYLSRRYSGPRWWLLRVVLRIGLAVRSRLARRSAQDGAPESESRDRAAA